MSIAYTIAGFSVGAIVGLTGVGGGSLMTPLLVLLFGINPSVAVGTDLLYAAVTKAGGTLAHGMKGTVDWQVTRRLASGSIPAAALTLLTLAWFAPGGIGGATSLIKVSLGVALLLTAVAIIFRKHIQDFALRHSGGQENPGRTRILTIITGAVLGVLVSISSVGAGALGVSALFFLYPRLPTLRIVGSDIAHAVPLTLVAGIGHWFLGSVDWSLLGSLLIGSLPGIWLGSHISTRVPDRVLRPILATMLVLVGSKLIAA
ncbi:sulfite exporter TauE/SafE family protein [Zoogloea sp.]|uniref:sulfite exporter TauE/SafE family protein n=1 Tax=Zoogloea sp. TaxID=49181 RepID=UPI0014169621|nr:MAG: sulfite exporter TauE/SafE family protein [Zoogloea sp.]